MISNKWIGRAAAEFSVVVVGVLVALALEGWWNDLQDRRSESEYIADLLRELDGNMATAQVATGRATAREALARAARILESGQHLDSAEAFVVSLVVGFPNGHPPRCR